MTAETPVVPTTATETPVVPATPVVETPKEPELISPQIAHLQKEEKRIRAEREALKDVKAQKAEMDKLIKDAKVNPLAFVNKFGISIEALIDSVISDGKLTPAQEAKLVVDTFKSEQEQERIAAEQARLSENQKVGEQRIAEIKVENLKYLETNKEKFEYTNALEVMEVVWDGYAQLAADAAAEGKQEMPMTFDEFATKYEQQLEKYVEQLLPTKKFKSKLSVAETPIPSPDSAVPELLDQAKVRAAKKTLTNNMAPSTTVTETSKPKSLAQAQAEARAAAMKVLKDGIKASQ